MHLLAQARPDVRNQLAILRHLLQLHDVARPRQRHWHEHLHLPRLRRHDHDAIAQKYRLVDRMGDEHHGLLVLLPDVEQLFLQQEFVLRVERRERLVHQQNFGIVGKRARDRHALAHTSGKLVGIILGETGETGAREIVADHFLDGGGWRAPHLEAVGGVVPHRQPGEDGVALEDHRIHRALRTRRLDLDGAGGDGFEAGKDAQQRGLAASARADDHEELARGDVDGDAVDRDELPERLAEIADADGRSRRQRFGGFEPGERAGHGWSWTASICRAEPSFTTGYFAPIGRGPRPLLEAGANVERRAGTMKRSSERILTTHVGSLIRPQPLQGFLRAKQAGEAFDAKAYEACLTQSVGAVVRRQAEAGIDVISDGEFGKSISWSQYVLERLSGFERRPVKPGANPFQRGADRERFAEFYAELDAREEVATRTDSVCIGPIAYTDRRSFSATSPISRPRSKA